MADSLVLKGVKDVRKHTGTEMLLTNPRRGGNTHQVKVWWRKGVNTTYTGCTIFDVTTVEGTVKLVLATGKSEDSDIRIDHDGNFNFSFYHINEIERAALFTDGMELIEHYVFPSIAGGPVMTVTPPGSADRPTGAPPATEITGVTVSGDVAPTAGVVATYSAVASGTTSDFTYTWGLGGGETVASGQGTSSITINWSSAGANSVTCVVGSTDENWDNTTQSDTLNVNVSESFADRVAGADVSVAVTVADTGSGNKYQIDGAEQAEITANATETIHFDLSDASLAGHPLKIYTDATKVTEVTVGIEQEGTDLLFTPPIAGSFSYQCANHAAMGGDITISA